MRSRNREVNIFNMSLPDVLCGALGAFCFMMLALFPYYKPAHLSAEDKQSYQNAQQMQDQLQQVENQIRNMANRADPNVMRSAQEALSQARRQIAQMQEQLGRTRAAMEQAQQAAQQQKEQAQGQLEQAQQHLVMKTPLLVENWWTKPGATVHLYVQESGKDSTGQLPQPFDPTKDQPNFFSTTKVVMGPGSQTWMIAETVPGANKVYYKLDNPDAAGGPVTVIGAYYYRSSFKNLPNIVLSAANPYALVGSIMLKADRTAQFIPGESAPATPAKE